MQFAALYPYLHQFLKPMFPDCLWSGNEDAPAIALTFDDGPHSQHTSQLLDVLDRYSVTANFFWLGACVERNPQIASEIFERGHWIGLHGYDHRSFPLLSSKEIKQQLEKTQAAIAKACHVDEDYVRHNIRDVRPPNGFFTPQNLIDLRQWGYRPVMWSVVPEDWVHPGVTVAAKRVIEQVRSGSVIVLHDGIFGGVDVANTAAEIIPILLDQGYEFVTIDQLWQQRDLVSVTTDV